MAHPVGQRSFLKPLAAGLAVAAIFVSVLSLPLQAASDLALSPQETSSWIMAAWGIPSLLTVLMIARYRQPLIVTGNIFILIFVLSLGGELSWPELVGATMAAGGIVLLLGITGATHKLAAFLPPPIVYGLLAGAVLGLFADTFTVLGTSTLLVGATLIAYFASRATMGERVPALLVALVVGLVVAVLASQTGPVPQPVWPQVTFTLPQFTIQALVTATPVIVVFIAFQANAPSIVFLRSQAYEPPERNVSLMSGAGTLLGSIFGPMGVSLSLPATALIASPEAGEPETRHWAGYVAAVAGVLVALTAGFATELIEFLPAPLLVAVVGLAVIGVLAQSLHEITKGPLILGPVVAFGVSLSQINLLGLGRFFWAIILGLAVSLLVERKGWTTIRGQAGTRGTPLSTE